MLDFKRIKKLCLLFLFTLVLCHGKSIIQAETTPTVTLSKTEYTNQNVKITLTFLKSQNVISVKYVKGSHSKNYVEKKGKSLTLSKQKASVSISKNATYTFLYTRKNGVKSTKKVKVSNIDKTKPTLNPTYKVMNQQAQITLHGSDGLSGLAYAKYIKGTLTDPSSAKWDTKATKLSNVKTFTVKSEGNYSILLADKAGNKIIKKIHVILELKGAWISYLEYASAGVSKMNENQFKAYVDKMFDNCVDMGMNTVIVQVRPSGDALYPSRYFPWSQYVSGTQGKNPGYDPMAYMITSAHKHGLAFYAWINPYRVSGTSTSVSSLSTDNQARKWRSSSSTSVKRNVLTYNGQLYYNPSTSSVRTLIVNGIKEIVQKYDVEGIVFDDYFYPNLGTNYKTNFDYTEYKSYKLQCQKNGTTAKDIVSWRRSNVNTLLKKVKTVIKSIDSSVEFGVSPQGNISNLNSVSANYCDIQTWLNSTDYIDFISPQIYWSTANPVSPYSKVVNQWLELRKKNVVKMYVSVAVYKAGLTKKEANALSPADLEWYSSDTNLKRQVIIGRETGKVDGFMFYRYDNMISSKAKQEMDHLISIL